MTLLHTQHGFGRALLRGPRSEMATAWPLIVRQLKQVARAAGRGIGGAFRVAHFAIVAAKLRRLRHERMMHRDAGDPWPVPLSDDHRQPPTGAANIPQRPLILDDKWDF